MDELAKKVAKNYGGGEAALDPSFILVIVDLINQIITAFKNCKKSPAEVHAEMRSPGPWQRLALRSLVRNQMGFREFRQNGDEVMEALLKTGREVGLDDVQRVW